MRLHALACPLAALVSLAGCASIGEAVKGPELTPIGQAPEARMQPVSLPMPAARVETFAPNSLWPAGGRTFFNDQRAARVGDILTVKIDIEDKAEVSNATNRSRTGQSEVGVTNAFGLETFARDRLGLPDAFDPSSLVNAEGSTSTQGQGAVNREEKIELTIAAIVVQILPNGNFVIDGRQEVRVNHEMRELTVAGIIRPEDIGSDNTVRHSQIAEARISYGGRGTLSAVQRPGLGQRVFDAISPW